MKILKRTEKVDCSNRHAVTKFLAQLADLIYFYPECDIFVSIDAPPEIETSIPRSKVSRMVRNNIDICLSYNSTINICIIEVIT